MSLKPFMLYSGVRRAQFFSHCSTAKTDDDFKVRNNEEQAYEDSVKEKILEASLPFVHSQGWSKQALASGAESLGYLGVTNGIFTNSEVDLIHHFNKKCNRDLLDYLRKAASDSSIKFDSKILTEDAIKQRLKMIVPFKDKWPQALGILSLPPNALLALNNYACLIDDICHHAGDDSVDFNWYAHRFAIGGIYKAAELCLIQDKSIDYEETWQFLSRRMEEVFSMKQFLDKGLDAAENTGQLILGTVMTVQNIFRLNQPK